MAIRGVWQVGGCVRDAIIGARSEDIDYAVEADSFAEMRDYIRSIGGEIFLEKEEFVTIRARVEREAADYVLCRRDGSYSDGRRPDDVTIGDIMSDLSRRDFTMNAIAMDSEGNYFDPFNGRADIESRIIRCVGSAAERMDEDSLRLVRAIRFSITKGFDIDSHICDMFENAYWSGRICETISQDRIRIEVNKMFAHDTIATIAFFGRYPIMAQACFGGGITIEATSRKR